MKIAKGFVLSEVPGKDGEYIVLGVGEASSKLNGFLTLNETGVFIWKLLENGATETEIVDAFLKEYDAPRDIIESDVKNTINVLNGIGAIDD